MTDEVQSSDPIWPEFVPPPVTPEEEYIPPSPAVQQWFSIYDLSTGRILSALSVYSTEERDANIGEGQGWIEGHYDPALFYVAGEAAVAYPPRPEEWMTFNYELGLWEDTRGPEDLVAEKARVMDLLSQKVIALRKNFITDMPGQEMIYLRKEQEGLAYLALTEEPEDLSMFPLIATEVGITAPTAFQVATIWAQLSSMWVTAAAQLEQVRLGTAAQISVSSTFEELTSLKAVIEAM